jgi:hypothetical protein
MLKNIIPVAILESLSLAGVATFFDLSQTQPVILFCCCSGKPALFKAGFNTAPAVLGKDKNEWGLRGGSVRDRCRWYS